MIRTLKVPESQVENEAKMAKIRKSRKMKETMLRLKATTQETEGALN